MSFPSSDFSETETTSRWSFCPSAAAPHLTAVSALCLHDLADILPALLVGKPIDDPISNVRQGKTC